MSDGQSEANEKWIEPQPERVMSEATTRTADMIIGNDAARIASYTNWLCRHSRAVEIAVVGGDWCVSVHGDCGSETYRSANMVDSLAAAVVSAKAAVTPAPGENE